jgi:hypothetical protein
MDDDKTLAPQMQRFPGTVLPEGTVIAGRFTVKALAGRGGMGAVYRAIDAHTGQHVALKQLHAVTSPELASRFSREALLLSKLRHPAVVAYVAHGITEGGQPFLAMEWLEGEDLACRLARQPLSLSETLALLRRATEGLAYAHQQGIVHRDLKPSNLLLRSGRPEDVVLVDFGLARHIERSLVPLTGSHMVLGTPGYMAPEQASGQPDITSSADIFSLGCVLYECLTGHAPFEAPHVVASLAKILFTEPAPLFSWRADLPPGLQGLVERMLVKEPRRRLPDAASVREALSAFEAVLGLSGAGEGVRPLSLAGAEQQLVSVLLVSSPAGAPDRQGTGAPRGPELRASLHTALASSGAQVELLVDGSGVATLALERGTATDQAALAARCALTLKERWPEAVVVLVTGRGLVSGRLPVGEAMDRAGQLLRQLEQTPEASAHVMMDEVTAGLLGPGFQLSRPASGTFLLRGEQLDADASRPLLGKPTPCVGREQELALLDLTFASCVEEQAARALLVTAPAGTGKSRLRHEFLRRLEQKGQRLLPLVGRADAMSAGAAYGLLGQVLRRLCGLVEGEDLESRRARLSQRVALHLPAEEVRWTVEFLGELCAIPFSEEGSPRLYAARRDPRLMSAQVSRALVTFLQAECTHQPVLLVLEDLHWGDALTVKLVDEALRELTEHPFMVLALARPEVKELFPGLWARRLQEMPLPGLSRKASARLVREVLGPQVSDSLIHRVVEQSDGNALFLEELVRLASEGRGEAPPETVLAVLRTRLLRMEPGLRQVLLAASIFGRTFWADGVRTLLGPRGEGAALEKPLRRLVELEVIESLPTSRFRAVDEYRFRHALVQEAAYGLVPDDQLPTGHQLAATWLEQMGEGDARVLATHYQRGQRPERAASFYLHAAELSFEQHDLPGVLRCAEEALACGVSGEPLARLRALQAVVAFWMDEMPRVLELGGPVLASLKAGGPMWCRLIGGLIIGSSSTDQGLMVRLSGLLLSTEPEPEAITAYLDAIKSLLYAHCWTGDRPRVEVLLGRLKAVGSDVMAHDALARGMMRVSEALFFQFLEARPWQALGLTELGIGDFRQIGSEWNALLFQSHAGLLRAVLGDLPGAKQTLRETLRTARRTEQPLQTTNAVLHLMLVLAGSSEPAERREAWDLASEFMGKDEGEEPYSFRRGVPRAVQACVLAASGDLHEAESRARTACALLAPFRSCLLLARRSLCVILLAQERAADARQVAELGVRELEEMNNQGLYAVAMYLALAEACFLQGDASPGEVALRQALKCVRARASDIPEGAARERFLRQVPENARTLELARQRWGDSAP